MSRTLGDFLKSINLTKEHLMEDEESEKDYVPYIVNRCLSYFPDTLFHAQEVNLRVGLTKKMQYEYLLYSVRKRKRFSPWEKKTSIDNLPLVMEYYNYSEKRAKEALSILSDKQIEIIKERLFKGGLKKNEKSTT